MLNSIEHEILNAHKYKNIKKFGFFLGSDKPRMLFFPLINVKMPTIVGILTFMSRKNVMLSWVEHEKSFITSGPGWRSTQNLLKVQKGDKCWKDQANEKQRTWHLVADQG